MASLQAKMGGERLRKREKKKFIVPITSYLTRNRKFKKKQQKIKKHRYGSFQAKTGWERPSQRGKRNYRSDQFLPDQEQQIPKNSKKIRKIKKHLYGLFS